MNYSKDQFFALMEAAEEQGGELLDEVCDARTYSFTGSRSKKVTFPMCGNSTIFDIPYLEDSDAPLLVGAGPTAQPRIKVCAVDDGLGLWPRFRERHDA